MKLKEFFTNIKDSLLNTALLLNGASENNKYTPTDMINALSRVSDLSIIIDNNDKYFVNLLPTNKLGYLDIEIYSSIFYPAKFVYKGQSKSYGMKYQTGSSGSILNTIGKNYLIMFDIPELIFLYHIIAPYQLWNYIYIRFYDEDNKLLQDGVYWFSSEEHSLTTTYDVDDRNKRILRSSISLLSSDKLNKADMSTDIAFI